MPFPSVFPVWWIANTSLSAGIITIGVLLFWRWRVQRSLATKDLILIPAVVALSVFVWRLCGNAAPLNDDPISGFSPNDILCPAITYIALDMFAAFRRPSDTAQWERLRVVCAVVSLVVNVMTI